MIQFHNITKSFGSHKVLDGINIVIQPQEFVSIVGVSGAGKSTLLHILHGAIKPTIGSVEVDGMMINDLEHESLQLYRRKIGMVFQDYKLLPKKTIYENIAFAMEVCNADEYDIKRRVAQVMEVVGISDAAKKFPYALSGGEQQRAAIARALVHNPNMILADEPTGNLDPDNTNEIMELLKKINDNGVTVLLASHDSNVINSLQKRVIQLKDGKVTADHIGGYEQ